MALLSIAEPGQSSAPHQKRIGVGIDLGTTNSLVGTMINGSLEIIKDEQGNPLCPSVVHYGSDSAPIIGYEALAHASSDPQNTIISVKRFIGKTLTEVEQTNKNLPYKLHASTNNLPLFSTNQGDKNAIEVSSQILQKLRNQAENRLGESIMGAVITVPAYFDDSQRQATKDAASLAGINVLRLLNEPTAAAIAYGINENQKGLIVVYDLGGGTFDVSILKMEKGVFQVLATGGNTALGGDDFDTELNKFIVARFNLEPKDLNHYVYRNFLELAIATKKALSDLEEVNICQLDKFKQLEKVLKEHNITVDFNTIDTVVSRQQFNDVIKLHVQKTIMVCNRVLKDAKLESQEIGEVILVGGSTRVPFVREQVESYFGKKPLCSIDPDIVVALGASLQANILVGNSTDDDYLLLDVLPLSLGVEVYGGLVEKIIPRNTTIPIARAQEFTTAQDGQTGLKLHVVQGERDMAADCRSLARFTLKGLPPRAAGALKIRVTYQVDADGLLSVSAREFTTNVSTEIQVKLSYGLTEDEIIKMIQDSNDYAEIDVALRKLSEGSVEAKLLCQSVEQQLEQYSSLLSTDDREQIERNLVHVQTLLEKYKVENENHSDLSQDHIRSIKEHANEIAFWAGQLEISTREFAAQIMTSNIKEVLTGKDINNL